MILLTDDLRQALRANAEAAASPGQACPEPGRRACLEPRDPVPVVKFFNPVGAATWLASELDADGDTLFGLADLGFGCPELGSFSLSEIASLRLPLGLRIERDLYFSGLFPLSVYAEAARRLGRITEAEAFLREVAAALRNETSGLPPPLDEEGAG